jgi:hypothetical protein
MVQRKAITALGNGAGFTIDLFFLCEAPLWLSNMAANQGLGMHFVAVTINYTYGSACSCYRYGAFFGAA